MDMELRVASLKVTQSWIRNADRVRRMVAFVRAGGIFTAEHVAEFHQDEGSYSIIKLSRFPDGDVYIHDGHHRAVGLFLGGREWLLPEEYEVRDWGSYAPYAEINADAGWVTPLDLKSEVRLPDVMAFKRLAKETPEEELEELTVQLKHMYAAPRTMETVEELAQRVRARHRWA